MSHDKSGAVVGLVMLSANKGPLSELVQYCTSSVNSTVTLIVTELKPQDNYNMHAYS